MQRIALRAVCSETEKIFDLDYGYMKDKCRSDIAITCYKNMERLLGGWWSDCIWYTWDLFEYDIWSHQEGLL